MKFRKEIDELLSKGIIDQPTADRIRNYYSRTEADGGNRLFAIFGILGALLVGLGVILIVAHNWDQLSQSARLTFSFVPTIIGQTLCFYVFRKRISSVAWREGASVFLFLSVGATISLIAQVYHLPSDLNEFLFTWLLLVAPLIYLMRSNFTSLLFIVGVTWLGWLTNEGEPQSSWFWLLMLFALPKYLMLWTSGREKNSLMFHHWIFVIAILTNLWTLHSGESPIIVLMYMVVLAIFYQIGEGIGLSRLLGNAYLIAGSVGTAVLLMVHSFIFPWNEYRDEMITGSLSSWGMIIGYAEFWWTIAFFAILLLVLRLIITENTRRILDLNNWAFVLLTLCFFVCYLDVDIARILINLFLLALALSKIKKGVDEDSLLILNYGLLVITVLVICRFFDTELSFVLRGLLFHYCWRGIFCC